MHIDARQLTGDDSADCDICIVGAGAAGIAAAREFLDTSLRVTLVESGGFHFDARIQALYDVEDVGKPNYPHRTSRTSRVRFFGGTTNHWGGQSRPLDRIDFEHRPWVPFSGWPVRREDLDAFYERAQPICQLGPYDYDDPSFWAVPDKGQTPFPFSAAAVETKVYQYSPPTRFGERYKAELCSAKNITVFTHANAFRIDTNESGTVVDRLVIKVLGGSEFEIRAKHFVLACGGIENARLLLFSRNSVHPNGLGNNSDKVGRYFAEHPTVYTATIHPGSSPAPAYFYAHRHVRDTVVRGLVHLSDEAQKNARLLNLGASLNPAQEGGYVALKRVLGVLLRRGSATDMVSDVKSILRNLGGVLAGVGGRLLGGSKYMPVGLYAFRKPLRLYCKLEQSPNPASRVTLSDFKDELGQNLAKLDWRLTEVDRHTLREGTRIIGEEFERLGLGTITMDDWLSGDDERWPEIEVNGHHTGTTRMSAMEKDGVVTPDCRVHGFDNLFVAGASVFPTAGCVNPTLTIVALAIRLADHVKALHGSGAGRRATNV